MCFKFIYSFMMFEKKKTEIETNIMIKNKNT